MNLLRVCKYSSFFQLRQSTKSLVSPLFRRFSESPLDINTNVTKDVILFKYENPRFYKIVNIFAACQFVFWSYLASFAFTTLRDAPVDKSKETTWWRKINLGENKYRNGIALFALFIAYGILAATWTYTLKSVRFLILCQGGKNISFVTYTPFGNNRIYTTSLKNVSCKESRTRAGSQLPLKVKGQYLHYIMDMRGEFKNPTLFDHTAGLKRTWKSVS